MRIISGKNKGRIITTPKHLPVRPTTDFAKEALFNILNQRIDFESIEVLDLFAGTGNISYEFISRNTIKVTALDHNHHCIKFIRQTAEMLHYNNLDTVQADYRTFIGSTKLKWDLIFADPPYEMKDIEKIPMIIFERSILKSGGLFILEHSKSHIFSDFPHFLEHRKYGNVNFSFFLNNV